MVVGGGVGETLVGYLFFDSLRVMSSMRNLGYGGRLLTLKHACRY